MSDTDALVAVTPLGGPTVPELARDLFEAVKTFRSLTIVLERRLIALASIPSIPETSTLEAIENLSATWATSRNAIGRLDGQINLLFGSVAAVHGPDLARAAMKCGGDEAAATCECGACERRSAKSVEETLAVAAKAGRS